MKNSEDIIQGKKRQYISNNTIYVNVILHESEIQRERYNLI